MANYEDLFRLARLESAGHFPAGYAKASRHATMRYLIRTLELALIDRCIPYCGPTITESLPIKSITIKAPAINRNLSESTAWGVLNNAVFWLKQLCADGVDVNISIERDDAKGD